MADKVCLTTYVYGDKYQDYIPLLLYSIGRAYPDYQTRLYLHGKLRDDLKPSVNLVKKIYTNFEIIENKYGDAVIKNSRSAAAMRWVLWDDKFLEYDYLYIVDIDMFYLQEPKSLLEQHVRHMNFIGSNCISNITRKKLLKNTPFEIARMLRHFGIGGVYNYIIHNSTMRLSGLHFIKTIPYFNYVTPDIMEKYRAIIYNNKLQDITYCMSDEPFLYQLVQQSGIDMSVFALQTSDKVMIDFNNPERKEFCPHHGIHLGLFRGRNEDLPQFAREILDSPTYKYYYEQFNKKIKDDILFKEIYKCLPQNIKDHFDRMNLYYSK